MPDDGPRRRPAIPSGGAAIPSSASRGAQAVRTATSLHPFTPLKEIDMKKTICAMKAALGVRGISGGILWRWVHYHTI